MLAEEGMDAAPREWMYFKLIVSKQRTSDPIDVYRNLLAIPPKGIKHFLPLLEIMMTLSMSTAIVERGFSHMNIVKNATSRQMKPLFTMFIGLNSLSTIAVFVESVIMISKRGKKCLIPFGGIASRFM